MNTPKIYDPATAGKNAKSSAAARRIASIHSIPPHLARDLASLAGFPDEKELPDQQLQNNEDAQK